MTPDGGDLLTHEDLVEALRRVNGLRDIGKMFPNFHFKSKAFLHFHLGADRSYADVRLGERFETWPVTTPAQRRALLDAVRTHVAQADTRRPR